MEHAWSVKLRQLWTLVYAALTPPAGRGRIVLAYGYGILCHTLFAAGVGTMIWGMYHGMTLGLGRLEGGWAWAADFALLAQFPLVHSLLLTGRGGRWLSWLSPARHAATLSTTTYAIVASVQLLALFALWSPTGVIWWQAEGDAWALMTGLYACTWLALFKAIFDAGVEVQSGALGWLSLAANVKPRYPDMPTTGLFALIRQPIYVAFALTLWPVPVWTPDQLAVAVVLTFYCLAAPLLKERRFARRYGARFAAYKADTPYALPRWTKDQAHGRDASQ